MTKEKGVVGVIVAMQKELDSIRESMTDVSVETISGIPFASGELEGHRVVVALSGVGKVFAAICTQTMIFRYHPSLIVNTGIAGTLTGEAGIGDVVVATDVVQHDMDTSPIGDPVGLISGINVIHIDTDAEASARFCRAAAAAGLKTVRGTVASGDQFVASRERKAEIVALFGGAACEMEGAAVGQVCYVNGVPFCVVRTISDEADGRVAEDYPAFARRAAERSCSVLRAFLRNL